MAGAEFQREWQDLLAAIALFGPARVALPTYLAADLDIQPLLERGLAEILIVDTTKELRERIARDYSEAFKRCRELEWMPGSSPVVSLDAPVLSQIEREAAERVADEADFYIASLRDRLIGLIEGHREIFGYYVAINELETFDALRNFNLSDDSDPAEEEPSGWSYPEMEFLQMLGLYVRDRAAVEAKGLRQHGYAYNPGLLDGFDEINRGLTERSWEFHGFAEIGVAFAQFDEAEFLVAHAFWSSFFELTNMIEVSALAGNQLYLPSRLPFDLSPGSEVGATTSESMRLYRLFLSESGRLPSPTSLRDLEQLQRDPGLSSLRSVLSAWTEASKEAGEGDLDVLAQIHGDIAKATRALKRSEHLGRAGKVLTYLSLPVAIADLLQGSLLGSALAPFGPALELHKARTVRKASWLRFGSP